MHNFSHWGSRISIRTEWNANLHRMEKNMTGLEYLERITKNRQMIDSRIKTLRDLEELACLPGGIDYSKDRVNHSASGDQMLNQVAEIVDLEREIYSEKIKLEKCKFKAMRRIERVPDPDCMNILDAVYVRGMSLKMLADIVHYEYGTLRHKKSKAIKMFEEYNPDLKKMKLITQNHTEMW